MNGSAFKLCAVIWRIMRPYLKIERKATARSGKTFEKMENNSKFERNIDGSRNDKGTGNDASGNA